MTKRFDVAVVGLGAAGSAALYELAQRGQRVIGLEQFEPGHDRGSSYGESRIIRLSYFEHPSYVPLLRSAYEAWRAFETVDGGVKGSLLTITGILEAGYASCPVVRNSLASSHLHGLEHVELDGRTINRRFPGFRVPHDWHGLFQPDGGFLRPEAAVQRFAAAAERRGADLRLKTQVLSIKPKADAICIETSRGPIESGSVVIATGAWITALAPVLAPMVTITRQVVGWFPTRKPELYSPDRCPVFILESEDDHIYGFPDFCGSGVKSASHVRGDLVQDPDMADRLTTAEDEEQITRSLCRYLPHVGGPASRMITCMYTRTRDGHFLIDHAPGDKRIVLASPCSGHGFKFASLLGKILADLAVNGATKHDISLFKLRDAMAEA